METDVRIEAVPVKQKRDWKDTKVTIGWFASVALICTGLVLAAIGGSRYANQMCYYGYRCPNGPADLLIYGIVALYIGFVTLTATWARKHDRAFFPIWVASLVPGAFPIVLVVVACTNRPLGGVRS